MSINLELEILGVVLRGKNECDWQHIYLVVCCLSYTLNRTLDLEHGIFGFLMCPKLRQNRVVCYLSYTLNRTLDLDDTLGSPCIKKMESNKRKMGRTDGRIRRIPGIEV
ncbi:hypothetical protein KSP39_PZI015825 [Platanthera zijinensis]|uniref:Uncharacterized protein n=1 Tax=Platanthera zijinensis TaxID=2320716 RepID=A0AAP0B8X7_9ASPA